MKVFAVQELGQIGGSQGFGPFGNISGSGLVEVTQVVSKVVGFMTVAAGVWFLFQLIIGGISWVTSGGDKNNIENAKNRLTHAFIGLIIVVAGWGILALAGTFLGYDILITRPDTILNSIKF